MPVDPADQHRRAVAFQGLHAGPAAFVVANAWDAGTARLLTQVGFPALATTSGGLAFALGRRDGANQVSREETVANVHAIAAATSLPVTADLESGLATAAEGEDGIAVTIRAAAAAGAVGGSIEDATGDPEAPVRPLPEAVHRVAVAVAAARELPFPFTLTARAENFFYGRPDLDDTIRRLQAFAEAGADVLYAPGLPDLTAVRAVCAAVDRPVNVLAGGAAGVTVAALAECGARRISVGTALARVALTATLAAAREIHGEGAFRRTADALGYAQANAISAW